MVVFNGAHMGAISEKLHIKDVIVYPPAITQTVIAPALTDGDIFARKQFGTRQVDVLFAVMEEDTAARGKLIQAVNEWAYSRTEQELRVPQEPNGHLMGVCSKLPQDSAMAFEELLTLSFTCHDPFFYADEESSLIIPIGTFGEYVRRYEAPPWRIEADITEPLAFAQWGIGDKHLIFSSVPVGKLVIDRKTQTATVDGNSIMHRAYHALRDPGRTDARDALVDHLSRRDPCAYGRGEAVLSRRL